MNSPCNKGLNKNKCLKSDCDLKVGEGAGNGTEKGGGGDTRQNKSKFLSLKWKSDIL